MELHAVRTWFDQKHGVVVLEDDVQNVVRDIRAISDRLQVYYNEQTNGYDVVERCLDGTDRLVLSTDVLDQRVVQRIRGADHWHGSDRPDHVLGDDKDFAAQIDAENEAIEKAQWAAASDRIKDAGERIHWALDLGPGQNSPGGKISLSGRRHRTRYK